jgi:hypothetical protein
MRYQYSDGVGVALDIAHVPLEVAPDQVTISTPYNQRLFEEQDFDTHADLTRALREVTAKYIADPNLGRHPLYRAVRALARRFQA